MFQSPIQRRFFVALSLTFITVVTLSLLVFPGTALASSNQYGPVTVTVSTRCPSAGTIVNLPIDPNQIHSITVSGQVNGSVYLYDKNGFNVNTKGGSPYSYSFTTSTSDLLQACVLSGGTATVSFQGQLNEFSKGYAGYAVSGFDALPNEYQDVLGDWTVPAVKCNGLVGTTTSATWLGLSGPLADTNSTIEQIGVTQQCGFGVSSNIAVYENFPQGNIKIDNACPASTPPPCANPFTPTVKEHDSMGAEVAVQSDGSFSLYLSDYTQKWIAKETVEQMSPSARYTAEWIEEYPGLPVAGKSLSTGLSDFTDPVQFTNCSVDNRPINLGGPSIQQITMHHGSGSPTQAYPSVLNGSGYSFSITWMHS
jgi:hypothetical protein